MFFICKRENLSRGIIYIHRYYLDTYRSKYLNTIIFQTIETFLLKLIVCPWDINLSIIPSIKSVLL